VAIGEGFESSTVYKIRVKGHLDKRWSDWFDGFDITYPSDNETLLHGRVVDQAALHGVASLTRLPYTGCWQRSGTWACPCWQLNEKSVSNDISQRRQNNSYLEEMEEVMEKNRTRKPPQWMFLLISVGGAWASGIYLGKITIEGASTGLLIPMAGFGVMGLIMAWMALSER
jgi:hypothetical protein